MTDVTRKNLASTTKGLLAGCAVSLLLSFTAQAQQVTGTMGSPGASTSIDGRQLPPPDPKFGGVIKDDALQS
jgi:hypothetical protein